MRAETKASKDVCITGIYPTTNTCGSLTQLNSKKFCYENNDTIYNMYSNGIYVDEEQTVEKKTFPVPRKIDKKIGCQA